MIARIEYNNTLAPVQDYGRHQTRALKNKKKGKVEDPNNPPKSKKDYDDRFYDLDDNFIDDGDMEEGLGVGLDSMGAAGFEHDEIFDEE